jgi:hypothetical protein
LIDDTGESSNNNGGRSSTVLTHPAQGGSVASIKYQFILWSNLHFLDSAIIGQRHPPIQQLAPSRRVEAADRLIVNSPGLQAFLANQVSAALLAENLPSDGHGLGRESWRPTRTFPASDYTTSCNQFRQTSSPSNSGSSHRASQQERPAIPDGAKYKLSAALDVPADSLITSAPIYGFADLEASAKLIVDCVEEEAFSLNMIPDLTDDAKMAVGWIARCALDRYFDHFVIPSLAPEPPRCGNVAVPTQPLQLFAPRFLPPVTGDRARPMNLPHGGDYHDSLEMRSHGSDRRPENPPHIVKQISKNVETGLMEVGAKFDSEMPSVGECEDSYEEFLNDAYGTYHGS